jgi:hypothetical protein
MRHEVSRDIEEKQDSKLLTSRDKVRFTSAAMVPGEGCTVTTKKACTVEKF